MTNGGCLLSLFWAVQTFFVVFNGFCHSATVALLAGLLAFWTNLGCLDYLFPRPSEKEVAEDDVTELPTDCSGRSR